MPKRYKVVVNAVDTDSPEILIHGPIGKSMFSDDGITSEEVTNALNAIAPGKKITIGINSQGGMVGEGLGIYNAIKARGADCTARIDGYACSIASVIPLACDTVVSPPASVWMIHSTSAYTDGNADEHRKSADMLDTNDEVLAGIYAAKTEKTPEEIQAAMDAETWFTGEEAVDFGLADSLGDEKIAKAVRGNVTLAKTNEISAGWKSVRRSHALAVNRNNANPNDMNKKQILAFLKKRGVELAEDSTEQQILAALDGLNPNATPTATATDANAAALAAQAAQLLTITAQLERERTDRITREVQNLADGRIPTAQVQSWVNRAIKDETILADLRSMPIMEHAPVVGRVEVVAEGPWAEFAKTTLPTHADHAKRYAMAKANWAELRRDAFARAARQGKRGEIMASNTFSAALTTAFLVDGVVTKLQNKWPALQVFTSNYSTDRYKPLATGEVKFASSTDGSVQENATNFETGDSSVTAVQIAVNQFTRSFHVTNEELNSGLRMADLTEINMAVFADQIIQTATTPITATNFPGLGNPVTPYYAVAPTSFGFSDLATLWGLLKKAPMKNLLLDGEYLARLINFPTYFQEAGVDPGTAWQKFGWDRIELSTNWTGAGANVRGFACAKTAIGAISGLPLQAPQAASPVLSELVITIPGPNVSISIYNWFSLSTRTEWLSYDIMFGSQLLDNSAGILITSQ
jgi:ATP-dependent protease ClpP protease subunit